MLFSDVHTICGHCLPPLALKRLHFENLAVQNKDDKEIFFYSSKILFLWPQKMLVFSK